MSKANENIKIRNITPDDAGALLEIYKPYVTDTAISFEIDVPSVSEFKRRIEDKLDTYPYLIAENDEGLLGYAYTSPFVGRAAYLHGAETTIYLRDDAKGMGIGRLLYENLERISLYQNIMNLYACIGYAENEDEYLTNASMHFHEKMGFKLVGKFEKCGYKFGRFYDMIWMEKKIYTGSEYPGEFIPYSFPGNFELL